MPRKKGNAYVEIGFDPKSGVWRNLASEAALLGVPPSLYIRLLLTDREEALRGNAQRNIWFPRELRAHGAAPSVERLFQGGASDGGWSSGPETSQDESAAAAADFWALPPS